MQFPVPQITTFLLLMHMAFGCCTHHAHACETNCCPAPTANAEACPCDTHRPDERTDEFVHGVGDFSDGGNHDERHHCDGDDCMFVHAQPTPDEINEFAAEICPLEQVAANDASSQPQLNRSLDQHHSIAGISLRTHLALRVLLI